MYVTDTGDFVRPANGNQLWIGPTTKIVVHSKSTGKTIGLKKANVFVFLSAWERNMGLSWIGRNLVMLIYTMFLEKVESFAWIGPVGEHVMGPGSRTEAALLLHNLCRWSAQPIEQIERFQNEAAVAAMLFLKCLYFFGRYPIE
jgi:hypothetical protein